MVIKRVDIWILCGLLLLVTGCIKENLEDCPVENPYQLSFIYYGNGATDIFNSKVESIQMYVFDSDSLYVADYSLSKTRLNELQGIQLSLEPGEYKVVCWGNITTQSDIISQGEYVWDYYVYNSNYLSNQTINQFDSLYYGNRTIIIPENIGGNDTVYFRSAHINVDIVVEGLSTTQDGGTRAIGDSQGWLSVRNVYVGYDFDMQVTGELSDMYPSLVEINENQLRSRFDLLRFKEDNPIIIDIYNGEGKQVYSLNLQNFLKENNINVENVNEITVPIYVRFVGQNIHVTILEWDSEIVRPIV